MCVKYIVTNNSGSFDKFNDLMKKLIKVPPKEIKKPKPKKKRKKRGLDFSLCVICQKNPPAFNRSTCLECVDWFR